MVLSSVFCVRADSLPVLFVLAGIITEWFKFLLKFEGKVTVG